MYIAMQVEILPEVGASVVQEARRIDEKQRALDRMQSALDAERKAFLVSLSEDWMPHELVTAGIFF